MRTANYKGDVTHIVGEKFFAEYLGRQDKAWVRHWVATDAKYDPSTNRTKVEFDQIGVE